MAQTTPGSSSSRNANPEVDEPDILFAYQYATFEATGNPNAHELSDELRAVASWISEVYPRPAGYPEAHREPTGVRTRSRSAHGQIEEFPTEWAINPSRLRHAASGFDQRTQHLRRHPAFEAYRSIYLLSFPNRRSTRNDIWQERLKQQMQTHLDNALQQGLKKMQEDLNVHFQTLTNNLTHQNNEGAARQVQREHLQREANNVRLPQPANPNAANPNVRPQPLRPSNFGTTDTQPTTVPTPFNNNDNPARNDPPTVPLGDFNTTVQRFKPSEVGIFEPKPSRQSVTASDAQITYHDVMSFTNRVRAQAQVMAPMLIRLNLDRCLVGQAHTWFFQELDEPARQVLRDDPNGTEAWCLALESRFRENPTRSAARLEATRYTIHDAQRQYDPTEYLQRIIRNGKNAGTFSEPALVQTAYNHMDSLLRRDLILPWETVSGISMRDFTARVQAVKDQWHDIYRFNPQRTETFPRYGNDRQNRFQRDQREPFTKNTYVKRDAKREDRKPPYPQNRGNGFPAKPQQAGKGYWDQKNRNPGAQKAYLVQDENDQGDEQESFERFEEAYYEENSPTAETFDEEPPFSEEVDAAFSTLTQPMSVCRRCDGVFPSNNQLHRHLRKGNCRDTTASAFHAVGIHTALSSTPTMITSDATDLRYDGYGFRGFHYITAPISLTPTATPELICLDSGCTMSLIDRDFLREQLHDIDIQTTPSPIAIRGISTNSYTTNEYVVLDLFFHGENGRLAKVTRELHLVNDLKPKMLIGADILVPESITLDLRRRVATIFSCESFQVALQVTNPPKRTNVKIAASETVTIPPRSQAKVPVQTHKRTPLEAGRDYLYEPPRVTTRTMACLTAAVVDCNLSDIIASNPSDQPMTILKDSKLGKIVEYDADGYVATSSDVLSLTPTFERHKWTSGTATSTGETKLISGVTVHGDPTQVKKLSDVVAAFPTLWNEDAAEFVDVPEENWMKVPLVQNWENSYRPRANKVYTLGTEDRKVVDKTFDALHTQERLAWTTEGTPFGFPVFVVWKTLPDRTRKGRPVVDIRGLNQISVPDSYPMPTQADILRMAHGCEFISTIDCAKFFYQWRIRPADRHKMAVVTHRGHEVFNVAIMGYKNSPAYVQRQMDNILRPHNQYAKAYLDDIVICSHSFNEHITHLTAIFTEFSKRRISLSPAKSYLGYPNVILLGQKVDGFGLSTSDEKLKAITSLSFPKNLKDLEAYLGLTGYLRSFVPYYAQIAKPLQERKNELNNALRQHTSATDLKRGPRMKARLTKFQLQTPSSKELNSFHHLQRVFSRPTTLQHFDVGRRLFLEIDSSRAFGVGAMLYHSSNKTHDQKDSASLSKPPTQDEVQPILFLSRLLTDAETRYWPTEMETAGLVWAVRKTRHMIESTQLPTVVYTDHAAIVSLARQPSLDTTAVEKLNLRLVRASEYLQQFRLQVHHRPGRQHIVPDALSRLATRELKQASGSITNLRPRIDSLDELLVAVEGYPADVDEDVPHAVTSVGMSDELKDKIREAYQHDPAWSKIQETVEQNEHLPTTDRANLPYEIRQGLIYYREPGVASRLCIPRALVKDVFGLAHDAAGHVGYHRTYERLSTSVYIRNMARLLRQYLRHCPDCQLLQTPRHSTHGSLDPISSPARPFDTITIDLITALPNSGETTEGVQYNALMSVTDKFSKRVTFAPGREDWGAIKWADVLIDQLDLAGWQTPRAILSDRDPRFTSELWRAIFAKRGCERFLFSTAYHPQTDGSSERSNQTLEIALRYRLALLQDFTKWPQVLASIQAVFNNSTNASTGRTPNEILFGFRFREPLDALTNPDIPEDNDLASLQALHRREAKDCISFAEMMMKRQYDRRHTPIFFQPGDLVRLRLHRGYRLPAIDNRKLGQQFVGPLKVIQRVGRLAYRLDIPPSWRIHPVISVAHLERASDKASDPYHRSRPSEPGPVEVEGDTETERSFEIERLMRRRTRRVRGRTVIEYLVRWQGYDPRWDQWYKVEDLSNAQELIHAFEAGRGSNSLGHH